MIDMEIVSFTIKTNIKGNKYKKVSNKSNGEFKGNCFFQQMVAMLISLPQLVETDNMEISVRMLNDHRCEKVKH